jgi:hypothetical protein
VVTVSWGPASGGKGTIDFDVFVSTATKGESLDTPFNSTLISGVSSTDITLQQGVTYFIMVRARDSLTLNQDGNVAEVSITP